MPVRDRKPYRLRTPSRREDVSVPPRAHHYTNCAAPSHAADGARAQDGPSRWRKKLPQGKEREDMMRKARQAETASQISAWLFSPGLQKPT